MRIYAQNIACSSQCQMHTCIHDSVTHDRERRESDSNFESSLEVR